MIDKNSNSEFIYGIYNISENNTYFANNDNTNGEKFSDSSAF